MVTVHGPLEGDFLEYYRALSETVGLVSLFEAQRTRAPDPGWLATVSNGGDVESFPFREDKDEYLVWLGRFCEDKAPHLAIDAARTVGLPIVLAGKCVEPDEKAYFAQRIRPRLGSGVNVHGIADAAAAYATALDPTPRG